MASITDTILNDGKTPITFGPRSNRNSTVVYIAPHSSGAPKFEKSLTATGSRAAETGNHKRTLRLTLPLIREVNGVTTSIGANILSLDVKFAAAATSSERLAAINLLRAALADAELTKYVVDLEGLF